MTHMEKTAADGQNDIDNVNKLLEENSKKSHLSKSSETSQKTPPGWRIRVCGKHRYVVSPSGQQFLSKRRALVFMVQEGHPEEHVALMRDCMAEDGWKTSDLLPHDCRYKTAHQGRDTSFLMPEGKVQRNRRAGLEYMVKEEFEQEEVEEMRPMLRHEGCQAGEHLPDNWFVRELRRSSKHYSSLEFATDRGEHLKSTKAAIELVQRSGADPEGLARLRRLPRGDRWAREESDHDNTNSKIKTERTKQDKSEATTRSLKITIRTEQKWESNDNTLPAEKVQVAGAGASGPGRPPGRGGGALQGRTQAAWLGARPRPARRLPQEGGGPLCVPGGPSLRPA